MIPATQPAQLVPGITSALLAAQRQLDRTARREDATWAIPRLDAHLRFALRIERNRALLGFDRNPGGWRQQQSLRYSLIAEPFPPAAFQGPVQWTIAQPGYLLDTTAEQEIAAAAALELDRGRWRYRGERPLDPAEVRREAERIRASMVNLVDGRGMVVFQTAPECYLLVRVADRPARDGVFLYRPAATPPIDIFSLQNDGEEAISVEPLLRLLTAVRNASSTAATSHVLPRLDWGWRGLDGLIGDLVSGYRDALRQLAGRPYAVTHYHPQGFQAELVYSCWSRAAQNLAADPFAAADEWIHNRVQIELSPALAHGRVSLLAPEFVADGKARDTLIAQLAAAASSITRAFASLGEPARDYETAIRDTASHRNVAAALSYDTRPPAQGFLIVWPANGRDFVFTCSSDGLRIRNIQPVLARSASARSARFSYRQFAAVHNFFRAIRLWRTRS
jgi:hypothetical protein